MRILIVEDEVMIRDGMAKLIRSHTNHTVAGEASNGEEGLEMVQKFRPDLVITDIRMPVMDGLEMIRRIHEMNISVHTVILSGYSEFDYAKRALQYGVDDYLLKPLAAEDIQSVLGKIAEKMQAEEKKRLGTPEQMLKSLLYSGSLPWEKEEEKAGIFAGGSFYQLYFGYTGELTLEEEQEVKERLKNVCAGVQRRVLFFNESDKTAGCLVIFSEDDREEFQKEFVRKVIIPFKRREKHPVWTKMDFTDIEAVCGQAREAEGLIKAALGLKEAELMTKEVLEQVQWEVFHYPGDIAGEIKNAICRDNIQDIEEAGEKFVCYMRQGIFKEQDIRHAYMKTAYLFLDTIKELDSETYERLQEQELLKICTEAKTLKELEEAYLTGIKILANPKRVREDISNYTIKRALNYIREHFQEGITLEEVSRNLDITPEYLSMLFNREMGVNFSVFLRKFRISHAKRLLKGTELKIYEVAEQIGYSDPKYFARVFKEEVGVSPVDYRQMN